jgi:hypothetical protein
MGEKIASLVLSLLAGVALAADPPGLSVAGSEPQVAQVAGGLNDMRPLFPLNGIGDCFASHAIETGKARSALSGAHVHGTNLPHLIVIQFGSPASSSVADSAVNDSVGRVFFKGSPLQIFNPIIGGVTIRIVSANHSLWTRTNERQENELMNEVAFPVGGKLYFHVTVSVSARIQSFPFSSNNGTSPFVESATRFSQTRPHAAIVADAVAGESRDVSVLNSRIEFGHDLRLQRGLCQERSEGVGTLTPLAF